ncbi:MAG: SAM-dependent chlorinase/fluorinase [Treponema sp.]|nr:SAM-dependent chlorinase/fluorinase [Treponema sp.]
MKIVSKAFLSAMFSIAAVFAVTSCASTGKSNAAAKEVEAAVQIVEAEVSSISKYGNCSLNITGKDLEVAGIAAGDIVFAKVSSTEIKDIPVGTNYSDVDRGNTLLKIGSENVELAINMGNFAKTYSAEVGTKITLSLSGKGEYLQQYEIRQLKKSQNREDYASDEVFANFRNVTAGKIAAGKLYRSCNPVLTDARAPFAEKLAKDNGIKVVLNLADSTESAKEGLEKAPYYKSLADAGNVVFLNMGVSFSDQDFIEKLRTGLTFLAEHKEGPYLIHCNEGKDRAGFVVSILEAINGASLAEMTEDYMLSFENYFGVKKDTKQYELIGKTIIDQFKDINSGKDVSDKDVAKVTEDYLINTVKMTAEQIAAIKANLQ